MSFAERVYAACSLIPSGSVTTYGAIANYLGCRSARPIGVILNMNQNIPIVPCHRVVAADGSLRGYVLGIEQKRALLLAEGVRFDASGRVAKEMILQAIPVGTPSPSRAVRILEVV